MKKRSFLILLCIATIFGCSRMAFPWEVNSQAKFTARLDGVYEARPLKTSGGALPYRVAHRMIVIFLVPQCPADYHWSGNRNLPSYLGPVKELLKLYADSTDVQHGYVFGASMGGSGVWRLLNEWPNTFAAAFVASGMYRNINPQMAAKTPLYVTVGGAEDDRPEEDIHSNFWHKVALRHRFLR